MSNTFSFRTLEADAGSEAHPLRVASIGDMGYGPASDATVARVTGLVQAGQIDLVIHDGDISYADGEMGHWDVFMRKVSQSQPGGQAGAEEARRAEYCNNQGRVTMSPPRAHMRVLYDVRVRIPHHP
jgi:hypothetical protein